MKRLLAVLLLALPMIVAACASPMAPTSALKPTATLDLRQRATLAPADLPVPYRSIEPTHVVTFIVAEITETLSTRGKAAIVWLADGVRHFGILDVDKASVSELSFSLEDNDKRSGDVGWSPTGNGFIYEQHNVNSSDYTQYDYDIFGIRTDSLGSGEALDKNIYYFEGCDWSPDGQYIRCAMLASHASGGGWCAKIYDSNEWKAICATGAVISCPIYNLNYCKSLPLRNGELWDPADSNPGVSKPSPTPTAESRHRIQLRLDEFCSQSSECGRIVSPNNHFIAYLVLVPQVLDKTQDQFWLWSLVALDKEQGQVWKIGDDINNVGWSADGRYLAWMEDNQVRVYDTKQSTVTAYTLSGAKLRNLTWSPLK